jgi:hypothetical protein
MTLKAGEKLGSFEILSAIGAGGQGEVYKARDTRLDRNVAIKVLPSHLSGWPVIVFSSDRFPLEVDRPGLDSSGECRAKELAGTILVV